MHSLSVLLFVIALTVSLAFSGGALSAPLPAVFHPDYVFDESDRGEPTSPPPNMPEEWRARWHGWFTYTGCRFAGYMYYSNNARQLRTDEMFEWDSSPLCAKVMGNEYVYQQDFNVAANQTIYHFTFLRSDPVTRHCFTIDLPYWWSPDYLQHGSYLGVQQLEGVSCNVYNTTGQFLAGSVWTYVDRSTNLIHGMRVLQPPRFFEDYYVVFDTGLEPSNIDMRAFELPFSEPCPPA
mmetsp:Transcript_51798/g.130037  ORF Transcript_51798/g.130037 Transcript_51798/m.130037 type:complete len:236 (-) Transcript_51798:77-784(-)|eukprot:CAMPEP_0177652620 /NCGR_PEP_ID=MMETSP0447-20121125/13237_1 /TAXON_ID=0 /ORGANISM="Stygamoeba regulata, Strain BSH-02190019" /LENGTH=235 /DNA_ID=CAMNT_0019155897 /DNA_START=117 /DNA_END=824 /DNA_ORIENTATION=-